MGALCELVRTCPGCEVARLRCKAGEPVWANGVAQVAVYAVRGHDFWHVLAGQFVEPIGYTPRLEATFEGGCYPDVVKALGQLTEQVYPEGADYDHSLRSMRAGM